MYPCRRTGAAYCCLSETCIARYTLKDVTKTMPMTMTLATVQSVAACSCAFLFKARKAARMRQRCLFNLTLYHTSAISSRIFLYNVPV